MKIYFLNNFWHSSFYLEVIAFRAASASVVLLSSTFVWFAAVMAALPLLSAVSTTIKKIHRNYRKRLTSNVDNTLDWTFYVCTWWKLTCDNFCTFAACLPFCKLKIKENSYLQEKMLIGYSSIKVKPKQLPN